MLIGSGAPVVLAHQGGWDEALFALVPIALFAGLLALANARANRARSDRDGADRVEVDSPDSPRPH